MKAEHQSMLNAKFLALVIKELRKNFTVEEIDQLDKAAMLEWINQGATLSELKIKATDLLRISKISGVKNPPVDPVPPLQ
jgi:hypothetical protein